MAAKTTDPYDFRAPGFVPDEWNSLLLRDADRTRSAAEQKAAAKRLIAELRREVPQAFDEGTEIIQYDGDLYIVGDYIRDLMSDDEEEA